MPYPRQNDIEIHRALDLATLLPRTLRGQEWIRRELKPAGWQAGARGVCFTACDQLTDLRRRMREDGIVAELIRPV